MTRLPLYQVDAFTDKALFGNPAAVCPLTSWLPDDLMQLIALENNLPETAFLVEANEGYLLRWFTPTSEVKLCGHATLAAAFIVFRYLRPNTKKVIFYSASGPLTVVETDGKLILDFPALSYCPTTAPPLLLKGLSIEISEVYRSMDYLVILENEDQLHAIQPDLGLLTKLDLRGVIISAPGNKVDFVSRYFAPKLSIPEDVVTGSAHCVLVPYWSLRLNKSVLKAGQYSTRLNKLLEIRIDCTNQLGRVLFGGYAALYLEGALTI